MFMEKKERKFTWCVRYYNVKSGYIGYSMYSDWTTREINEFVANFIESHKDYVIRVFKYYKDF